MVVTLSHCQTIATFQRNISQHRCAQHVVCIWAPCCDVLRHVGCCWLKLKMVKFEPTTTKMSQHGGQTRQQCCNMSCLHAAIVWPGLKANPSAIQDDRSANSPFRVFNTLVAYPIFFSSRLVIFSCSFPFFFNSFSFFCLFLVPWYMICLVSSILIRLARSTIRKNIQRRFLNKVVFLSQLQTWSCCY